MRRIDKVERQVRAQSDEAMKDPISDVDRLLAIPVDALVSGEPTLAPDSVRIYRAVTLAHLSFARERPELYTDARVDDWRARSVHAESLLEALEEQDGECEIREDTPISVRLVVNALRQHHTGVFEDREPL
jgi:hypothetical protein